MSYDSRTGAVLFAARLDRVAAFYSSVLGLSEANRDDDHILPESPGFQLVVHRIPGRPAATAEVAERPVRRAAAAIKPVFFVRSVATVRAIANAHGGAMDPEEKEWRFHGALVCDALDPDGNSFSSAIFSDSRRKPPSTISGLEIRLQQHEAPAFLLLLSCHDGERRGRRGTGLDLPGPRAHHGHPGLQGVWNFA